jgi:hypothetical protein
LFKSFPFRVDASAERVSGGDSCKPPTLFVRLSIS